MKKRTETLREYHLRVHQRLEENIEQNIADLQSSRKSDDTDDYVDRYFHEPIALFLSRRFIKIGLTPNMITLLSMLAGVLGGMLFYPQDRIANLIGILLQITAAILDCSDGQVARMTDNKTKLGRVLDGTADGINFAAVYFALAFRLMNEAIPFTGGIPWRGWIWPLILFCGGVCHAGQARIADYYRMVHLFFQKGNDLPLSSEIYEEYTASRKDASLLDRFWQHGYYNYTRMQERATPKLQALLGAIADNGGVIPYGADTAYTQESHKIIQLTNVLTFSLRAYLLYILVLTGLYIWYFPFVIIVMELIKRYMIRRYESIAETVRREYFGNEGKKVQG